MRYTVLATDYDGTLAHDGSVGRPTIEALERLRAGGVKLVMVTGRELPDLLRVFGAIELFDYVVAENGGLLYEPPSRAEHALGEPPPPELVAALRQRNVAPLSAGRVILATLEPKEDAVRAALGELGIERQLIFNKGALMLLPAGVDKASGLAAALERLGSAAANTVGVGDAENDHAFLSLCGCSVAVANALPSLKQRVKLVTRGARGDGVVELIDAWLAGELDLAQS